jgi:Protein of unknown function (DUF4038)/Domain of unknown function (DUF5060)/Putative collagen-binding domain of a collagenase
MAGAKLPQAAQTHFKHIISLTLGLLLCVTVFGLTPVGVTAAPQVPNYGIFELTLTAAGNYPNPYALMPGDSTTPGFVVGTFTGPSGQRIVMDGFWDGGITWRIRMAPTAVGTWSYTTSSSDPGLNGNRGFFETIPSSSHGFVRIHSDNSFAFAYDDGTPFFWLGDSHIIFYDWKDKGDNNFRFDNGSFQSYWNTRASQGFNSIYFGSWLFRKPGNFAENEGGFNFNNGDPDQLNPTFWQWADKRVQYATSLGLVPGLGIGWSDQGIMNFGNERLMRALRYLVARYAAYNVMWILFGEWDEGVSLSDLNLFGRATKTFDPYGHLTSTHSTGIFGSSETWADITVRQGSGGHSSVPLQQRAKYSKPFVNVEFYWRSPSDLTARYNARRQAAWTIVTNGGYVGYGEDRELVTPGLNYMRHLGDFFRSRTTFWLLQPHTELVTNGTGYSIAIPGQEYVTYLPTGGSITLDLSGAPQTLPVEWYNPRTGEFVGQQTITGGAAQSFSAPDSNDWVLHVGGLGNVRPHPPTGLIVQ